MLDGLLRRLVDPALNRAGRHLHLRRVSADAMTLAGLAIGMASAAVIAAGGPLLLALAAFLAGRVADGLDGAIARQAGKTDFGGYLDIVSDFTIYAAVPLAMVLRDPEANAVAGAVLLAAFYINGATFLAYAAVADRRKMATSIRGEKSLYFTAGLAEGSETILAFTLFLLWPAAFPAIAYAFSLMCIATAMSRLLLGWRTFGEKR